MANIESAKKRARQTIRKTAVNTARKSRIRTMIRKVEEAIAAGNPTEARNVLKAAQPEIMSGVTKGVLHIKTASRKISRFSKRIVKLSQTA